MKELKELKRIRNQGRSPHCFAAAICGVVEYHLKDNTVLDAKAFYEDVARKMGGRNGNITKIALLYAKKKGIKIKGKNERLKIKDFKRIRPSKIWGYPEPLIIGCDIETGESLTKRLDKKAYVKRRMKGYHEMVYVDTFGFANHILKVANSWGTEWGDNGYCYIKRTLQKSNDPFIMDAHRIIL